MASCFNNRGLPPSYWLAMAINESPLYNGSTKVVGLPPSYCLFMAIFMAFHGYYGHYLMARFN